MVIVHFLWLDQQSKLAQESPGQFGEDRESFNEVHFLGDMLAVDLYK